MEAGTPTPQDPAFSVAADVIFAKRGFCGCILMPWSGPKTWERIHPPAPSQESSGDGPGAARSFGRWCMTRGREALMKVRECSELLAGPRWKTFIRRFRRVKNRFGHGGGRSVKSKWGRHGAKTFQYDATSYSLNFDDGQGQSNNSDGENARRGFSARYVAPTSSAKSSMDLGGEHYVPLPALIE